MNTITRVAQLVHVLARGGRLERSRVHLNYYTAFDEIGARFDVWVNAVDALERRGRLEIVASDDQVVTYRLKAGSTP